MRKRPEYAQEETGTPGGGQEEITRNCGCNTPAAQSNKSPAGEVVQANQEQYCCRLVIAGTEKGCGSDVQSPLFGRDASSFGSRTKIRNYAAFKLRI